MSCLKNSSLIIAVGNIDINVKIYYNLKHTFAISPKRSFHNKMSYLQLSNLAIVLGTISTIPIYIYLYVIYRERFMGIWTMCWLILFTRFFLFDYGLIDWNNSFISSLLYQACYIIATFLLVCGTHNFTNRPLKKHWFYSVMIIIILSILSSINHLPLIYKLIPLTSFSAIALIYTGYSILKINTQWFGKYITGCSLILWGLLTFIISFCYQNLQNAGIYSAISLICAMVRLLIAGGILLVYFEKTRTDLILNQKALQKANMALQHSNQELNHFCHSVAHDFKSPLQSINKLSKYLLRDYSDKIDSNGQEIITHIQNKSAEVVNMTDHLLELSRMSQKEVKMDKISLELLFHKVYKELIDINPKRNINFTTNRLPIIYGDPIMIKILVTNILSNALKYTRNREQTIIKVTSTEEGNNYIISVKDNGAGFDMSESSRLFKIFERLHSVDEFEGTGVGLVVCQKILKRHNGKAWLIGSVNNGAIFSFSFPKKPCT